jgi:hypothetical protein
VLEVLAEVRDRAFLDGVARHPHDRALSRYSPIASTTRTALSLSEEIEVIDAWIR